MDKKETVKYREEAMELAAFIKESPTPFHVTANIGVILEKEGFMPLQESRKWEMKAGGKYYVTRNHSSIIAFEIGEDPADYNFQIAASHSDSPTFKVKENAQMEVRGHYTKLNTEGYGGMLCGPWFDRPLSLAGRAVVKEEGRLKECLVKIDRDLLMIPSLAIHMNRQANEGQSFNKQTDMLPLIAGRVLEEGEVKAEIAGEIGVKPDEILGMDLFLYNRMEPSIWGMDEEFLSCPQLDDLQCAYASLKGFLAGKNPKGVNVFACFDNEEVGSGTKQGAASTFLADVLKRINSGLGKTDEDFCRAAAFSFMISCDNAHAVHPNYTQKTDEGNCAYINEGIVVKSHAGQKYTSDGVSIAIFKAICEKAGVPLQYFANRSDMAGGSTLGNLAMAQVSMKAVDIGLPQLAMHSPFETSGVLDIEYLKRAAECFFRTHIHEDADGAIRMETE